MKNEKNEARWRKLIPNIVAVLLIGFGLTMVILIIRMVFMDPSPNHPTPIFWQKPSNSSIEWLAVVFGLLLFAIGALAAAGTRSEGTEKSVRTMGWSLVVMVVGIVIALIGLYFAMNPMHAIDAPVNYQQASRSIQISMRSAPVSEGDDFIARLGEIVGNTCGPLSVLLLIGAFFLAGTTLKPPSSRG